jgi:DNA-binding NarL/FixJ family response regulator
MQHVYNSRCRRSCRCSSRYKQFFEADPSMAEVGEATTGNETFKMLRLKKCDLLLMDIHMPDRSGLEILKHDPAILTCAYSS